MSTEGSIPGRRETLAGRLRLTPSNARTAAILLAGLLLAGYVVWGVAANQVIGTSGGGLPGPGTTISDAIFGQQPLPPIQGYPRLEIKGLGIDLLISPGDGKTPPAQARAWVYPGTAMPGSPGNSYLYAHDRRGAFLPLHQIKRGDEILVEEAPGDFIHYQVIEIHTNVTYNDFTFVDYRTTQQRLTLQTCDGWRDTDPRFIVVAQRV